jgi:hypothetical protein
LAASSSAPIALVAMSFVVSELSMTLALPTAFAASFGAVIEPSGVLRRLLRAPAVSSLVPSVPFLMCRPVSVLDLIEPRRLGGSAERDEQRHQRDRGCRRGTGDAAHGEASCGCGSVARQPYAPARGAASGSRGNVRLGIPFGGAVQQGRRPEGRPEVFRGSRTPLGGDRRTGLPVRRFRVAH